MGIYFQTARQFADNPAHLAVLKKEPVRFSTRGWLEFSGEMRKRAPDLSGLLGRLDGGNDSTEATRPLHPDYVKRSVPLTLTWTADECRHLFPGLSRASLDASETAYDFWEFLAIVCCGINEEGLVSY